MKTLFVRTLVLIFFQSLTIGVSADQTGVSLLSARRTMAPKQDRTTDEKLKNPQGDLPRSNPKGKRKCCENGGICILGSFCHCKDGFFGRYCEFSVIEEGKSCGVLHHGYVGRVGCALCRCTDGNFYCVENIFSNCDNETTTNSQETDQNVEVKETKNDRNILLLSIKTAAEHSLNLKSHSYKNQPSILVLLSAIHALLLLKR